MLSRWTLLAAFCSTALACGSSPTPTPTTPSVPAQAAPSAGATFAEQAAAGQKLFAENCASCHGASGQGAKAPAVVGAEALPSKARDGAKRTATFDTYGDVHAYIVKAMPPGAVGSLKPDEYLAIMAFDMKANGVARDKALAEGDLASLKLR